MDKLDEIFRLQEELNPKSPSEPKKGNRRKDVRQLTIAPALKTRKDISQRKKLRLFDVQNARVEVVDLFHFLISLAQVLRMTPDDVYNAYLKKHQVNIERQESGYSKKDEADSRHI